MTEVPDRTQLFVIAQLALKSEQVKPRSCNTHNPSHPRSKVQSMQSRRALRRSNQRRSRHTVIV